MTLLNANGQPLPTKEEKANQEAAQHLLNTIIPLLVANKADINMTAMIGINLILHAYSHIPPDDERNFINNTVSFLANAFGQATVRKQEVNREARRAANSALGQPKQ